MKALIKNADPSSNPKTTFPGTILFVVGLALLACDLFDLTKKPIDWYMWAGSGGLGLLLIIAPDIIITNASKFLSKKVDQS